MQPDPAIGVGERGVVVADHERRRTLLVHELADQGVDERRGGRIQLARGLVGEQQPRAMRERRAQRDPLLLAAREAPGQLVRAVAEADAIEQQKPARSRRSAVGVPRRASGSSIASRQVRSGESASA